MLERLPNKKTFRPDEVASILGVSRRTIFRWLNKGLLEAITVKGSKRIPQDALHNYLARQQVST